MVTPDEAPPHGVPSLRVQVRPATGFQTMGYDKGWISPSRWTKAAGLEDVGYWVGMGDHQVVRGDYQVVRGPWGQKLWASLLLRVPPMTVSENPGSQSPQW